MLPPDPTPRFDTAVLIGRFQPFHAGHAALLEHAFLAGRRVALVLGSAGAAPTPRNPFTASEREAMIRASLDAERNARLVVVGQRDVWDTERWAREVRAAVEAVAPGSTVLVGFHKDDTSSYLDCFPEWSHLDTGRRGPLDATPLRELLLSERPFNEVLSSLREALPAGTFAWIAEWAKGAARIELTGESIAIRQYRERWGSGPFLASQAVVRSQAGLLLVRRDERPGKGLWELPGDFLLPGEQLVDAARRAVATLCGLDLAGVVPVAERIFAHPGRSLRGRIATHAFLFEPEASPVTRGGSADGAREARWVPAGQILSFEGRLFEDHFHIADTLLGGVLTA